MALCILCMRFAYPTKWEVFPSYFGRQSNTLNRIFLDTLDFIASRYREIILWHPLINFERMKAYSQAIDRAGGGNCIWGFVDGTFKPCCRPKDNKRQKFMYSGYKKSHGMKMQGICTPDGMILSLAGPYEGKLNDYQMMLESGIEVKLAAIHEERIEKLFLYGDAAYRGLTWTFGPYLGGKALSALHQDFNRSLSSVRISIEQCFGRTGELWMWMTWKRALISGLMPIGSLYQVAVLLTNCMGCFRTNVVSNRFDIKPPSIEQYLNPNGMFFDRNGNGNEDRDRDKDGDRDRDENVSNDESSRSSSSRDSN
jgi:hypothetical protein